MPRSARAAASRVRAAAGRGRRRWGRAPGSPRRGRCARRRRGPPARRPPRLCTAGMVLARGRPVGAAEASGMPGGRASLSSTGRAGSIPSRLSRQHGPGRAGPRRRPSGQPGRRDRWLLNKQLRGALGGRPHPRLGSGPRRHPGDGLHRPAGVQQAGSRDHGQGSRSLDVRLAHPGPGLRRHRRLALGGHARRPVPRRLPPGEEPGGGQPLRVRRDLRRLRHPRRGTSIGSSSGG